MHQSLINYIENTKMQENNKPSFGIHSFEQFIAKCCKAKEANLREFIKKILTRNGFNIVEDDYRSPKNGVPNLIAKRGNPNIALLAHTDVCREHNNISNQPTPEFKTKLINGEERLILTDRFSGMQIGGDDRLGVAINLWIALNSGYEDLALMFFTDEEIGAVSSSHMSLEYTKGLKLLVQVDRGNRSNQLVTSIYGLEICRPEMSKQLIDISNNIGMPRYKIDGMLTDVHSIKSNGFSGDAVNMTCGYHNSYGNSSDEFIDIKEARETMKFVSEIVKADYLGELNYLK